MQNIDGRISRLRRLFDCFIECAEKRDLSTHGTIQIIDTLFTETQLPRDLWRGFALQTIVLHSRNAGYIVRIAPQNERNKRNAQRHDTQNITDREYDLYQTEAETNHIFEG